MSLKSFPKPSELPVPAGPEGWATIYPYYLVFQAKHKEQGDAKFRYCHSKHWPTVFKPFETIGGESKDQVAVNSIMGHADASMAAVYRERIDDKRLKAVTDHMRKWLFAEKRATSRKKIVVR